ncbi:MAG: histidine kinase, partial [Clostridia bacterium]|nr:histidine kinase [Clostridia bacterium]
IAMVWNINTLMLLFPVCFLLIGLTVTVVLDPYISKKHRVIMFIIIALSLTLVAQNIVENALAAGPLRRFWRTTASVYGYTVRPVILILFLYIICPDEKHLGCWALALANFLIHITAFFSHICLWIDNTNHYHGGLLSKTCLYISLLLLAYCLYRSVRNYSFSAKSEKRGILIHVFVVLMILAAVFMDGKVGGEDQPVTFLTYAIVIGSVFYYIWLHLRFVQMHEDDLKARQRIKIMMSQIRPHFLYNTLSSIQALCLADPEKAFEVTERFGTYLRQNIDSLDQPELIPFPKELEHTRVYSEIEMIRFPSIRIEYDTEDVDFRLPALTVQPIVENAIRHGVRGKAEGVVRISTRKINGFHEIGITDNGCGFDTEAAEKAEGSHIGIRSVRERLAGMCGGTMTVESRIGAGTRVTIRIPAEEADEKLS